MTDADVIELLDLWLEYHLYMLTAPAEWDGPWG